MSPICCSRGAASQQRQIAIRVAVGAGRARLGRQFPTESLLLSFAGAGLGALFAQWGSRLLVGFLTTFRSTMFLDLSMDMRVMAFTVGVALATCALFGLAPAWLGTRTQPQEAMRAGARNIAEGHSRFNLGKLLVVLQIALSLVLLAGAGLMLRTFGNLATVDAGFERDHVLLVKVDLRNSRYPAERLPTVFEVMRERLKALPGVLSASFSDITPIIGSSSNMTIEVDGFVAKSRMDSVAWTNRVGRGFFETFHTPVLQGRDFDAHDVGGAPMAAIVNEALAKKFFGSANPVGRHFRTNLFKPGPPIEIVGLVRDATYRSLREDALPTYYTPYAQDEQFYPSTTLELRGAGTVRV
jgi:putative ABC transport system permease protein